jgi:hypothetical protein
LDKLEVEEREWYKVFLVKSSVCRRGPKRHGFFKRNVSLLTRVRTTDEVF